MTCFQQNTVWCGFICSSRSIGSTSSLRWRKTTITGRSMERLKSWIKWALRYRPALHLSETVPPVLEFADQTHTGPQSIPTTRTGNIKCIRETWNLMCSALLKYLCVVLRNAFINLSPTIPNVSTQRSTGKPTLTTDRYRLTASPSVLAVQCCIYRWSGLVRDTYNVSEPGIFIRFIN